MIKAILFDLGGVLVTDVFIVLDSRLAKMKNIAVEQVKEKRKQRWRDYELGNMDGIDFMQGIVDELHIDIEPEKLLEETYSLINIEKDVFDVLKRLKKSGAYRLGVISNNSFEWSAHARETLGLGSYFDAWVVSCDIGLKKPDKEIYLFAAEKLGVKPEDCIFIDNKKVNVEGALAAGMKGIHFRGAKQLVDDLKKLGVVF